MSSFTHPGLRRRFEETVEKIKALQEQADQIAKEEFEETRFLSLEERVALNDWLSTRVADCGDKEDIIALYMDTQHYCLGQSYMTDRDALALFLEGGEGDGFKNDPLWIEVLSRNLTAVAVVGELLAESEERRS